MTNRLPSFWVQFGCNWNGNSGFGRNYLLILTITGLATGFLILASTELVGSPWINISLSDLLLEKGSAILSLLVVEIGIFVILFISREKKQTEVKNLRAISLWLTFI